MRKEITIKLDTKLLDKANNLVKMNHNKNIEIDDIIQSWIEHWLKDDGYHTFDELYYHRMILFSVICKQNIDKAWKSKLHADGTMFDNFFIVGLNTSQGQYSYHYHIDHWDNFNDVKELERAPEWDGHKPEDIERLLSLCGDI